MSQRKPTRSQTISTANFLSLSCCSSLSSAEAPRTQVSHEGESKATIRGSAACALKTSRRSEKFVSVRISNGR